MQGREGDTAAADRWAGWLTSGLVRKGGRRISSRWAGLRAAAWSAGEGEREGDTAMASRRVGWLTSGLVCGGGREMLQCPVGWLASGKEPHTRGQSAVCGSRATVCRPLCYVRSGLSDHFLAVFIIPFIIFRNSVWLNKEAVHVIVHLYMELWNGV